MTGKTHRRFWKSFESLPAPVQKLAREKYALWKRDPYHHSLQFEERRDGICVVRIGNHYRALGLREGDVLSSFPAFPFRLLTSDFRLPASDLWLARHPAMR